MTLAVIPVPTVTPERVYVTVKRVCRDCDGQGVLGDINNPSSGNGYQCGQCYGAGHFEEDMEAEEALMQGAISRNEYVAAMIGDGFTPGQAEDFACDLVGDEPPVIASGFSRIDGRTS